MDKQFFITSAQTKMANIKYAVEICLLQKDNCAAFANKEKFDKLCQYGCTNYNLKWSCPPLAPSFRDVAVNKKNIYIFYLRVDLAQFDYIKNDYLKIKAANSILKSRADRYLRGMAQQYGKYISTGSCRLCKPCKLKLRMPCAHSSTMTYSFEALGINVVDLVETYFEKPLLWYVRGSLPEYTSVVCGLLTNDNISLETLQETYLLTIKV